MVSISKFESQKNVKNEEFNVLILQGGEENVIKSSLEDRTTSQGRY